MNFPKPMTGVGALAHWLNRLLEACRARELKPGPGYRLKRVPGGVVLQIDPPPGAAGKGGTTGGGMVAQISETGHANYFKAILWDGTHFLGDTVVVAKHFEFWQVAMNGMGPTTNWDLTEVVYTFTDDDHRSGTDIYDISTSQEVAVPRYNTSTFPLVVKIIPIQSIQVDDGVNASWAEADPRVWYEDETY